MKINFTKMQGLGNDFVVIDACLQSLQLTSSQLRLLADRQYGIGCDQILLLSPARNDNSDYYYQIYNADGSEAEQCGNGARCMALYVIHHKFAGKQHQLKLETPTQIIELTKQADDQICVNMGNPIFTPELIPFVSDEQQTTYPIELAQQTIQASVLSMGNPHCVINVADIDDIPLASWGPQLNHHPQFPSGVNVGFMQVINQKEIKLRVYERGVGETLACGSGACAAMVAARCCQWVDDDVTVTLKGGKLKINWQSPSHPVLMTGPATEVFQGTIVL